MLSTILIKYIMKTQVGSLKYLGVDLDITYNYSPYSSGVMWESNGEIGYPDEGGELYILSVEVGGVDIYNILTEDIIDSISIQFKEENEL